MKKHFVRFFSPGTLFAEISDKPVDSWSVGEAVKLARTIKERYGATPYGFQFVTRERGNADLDSRETKTSHMYFLGGVVETFAEIKRRNNPKEAILLSNMKCNGWKRVVVNDNSWRIVQPLQRGDKVLDFTP